jgi:hypothetical protein
MSANNSEHIPPSSSLEGLLADAKVNNFDHFRLLAIENILGFNISMAYISMMQVLYGINEFLDDEFQLFLIFDRALQETRFVKTLHDEVGAVLLEVQIERFIFDNGRMAKLFQINEISLQF